MSKCCVICEWMFIPFVQPVFNQISTNVDVISIPTTGFLGSSKMTVYLNNSKLCAMTEFRNKMDELKYDTIIMVTHNGNPFWIKWITYYDNKHTNVKWLDIEHDIMGGYAETSSRLVKNHIGNIVFTKPQTMFCQQHGITYYESQWWKTVSREGLKMTPCDDDRLLYLDDDICSQFNGTPDDTLLIMDSNRWIGYKIPEHITDTFKYVYYKTHNMKAYTDVGSKIKRKDKRPLHPLPKDFHDTGGVLFQHGTKIGKFWLTVESSTYVEALMCGAIPIIIINDGEWGDKHSQESNTMETVLDEIYSRVQYSSSIGPRFNVDKCITTTNLQSKIDLIKQSDYKSISEQLSRQFIYDTTPPGIVEVLNSVI